MTAKEALQEFINDLSEDEAERWLRVSDPHVAELLLPDYGHLTAGDLLQLPKPVRSLILRIEASYYTAEDAAEDLTNLEEWEVGTRGDIDSLDA